MKLKNSLIVGSFILLCSAAMAQDKPKTQPNPAPQKGVPTPAEAVKAEEAAKAEEKIWMDYMTPGEMHKMLAADNGDWHEELTFWMGPGQPPTKAEADCNSTMILGDRYQTSIHTGIMMGMPFEGHSTVGFDNSTRKFQSSWIDNMGTGIMFLEGKYDEKTKSITFTGKAVDPGSGKEEKVREILKFTDDKTRIMEMYMTKNGTEFKNMQIVMTRK